MNCKCGKPVYVNEKGFAGKKPFVAKFCAECLAGMFAELFDEAVEQSVQRTVTAGVAICRHGVPENRACPQCGDQQP